MSCPGSCTSGVGPTVAIGIVCRLAILCWHAEVPLLVRKAGSPVLECWHGDLDQQHS